MDPNFIQATLLDCTSSMARDRYPLHLEREMVAYTGGHRDSRFLVALRALRTSVATVFVGAERPTLQQPVDQPVDSTAIV